MIFNPGEELLVERYIKELKEKDLQKTPAIEKYGYGAALRSYYSLPSFIPLLMKGQHGVCLWNEIPSSEKNSGKRVMLVFNERWMRKWRGAKTGKWVVATPNPFLLYKRKFNLLQLENAIGCVFFYAHSAAKETAENDHAGLIRELINIPSEFGECLISMHYIDVMRGEYIPFLKAGFKVFCAGHYSDKLFPARFYEMLSSKKYALSNVIGSHYFYAVEHGLPFSYVGSPPAYKNNGNKEGVWNEVESALQHISTEYPIKKGFVKEVDERQLRSVRGSLVLI